VATEVFLHIGPPKTGTTYLQDVLWHNREVLRRQGVVVPGRSPVSQFHAAVEVVGRNASRLDNTRTTMAWDRLMQEVAYVEGERVVISHENFGQAGPGAVRRVLADLAPARVHVVSTARAPVRVAPAAWQERLKNRSEQPWPAFVSELRAPGPFWHQHGGGALAVWAAALDPSRVHVVTVPPEGSPPGLLWRRFAQLIGVEPNTCEHRFHRRNTSLGVEGAALLRRLNADLRDTGWPTYRVAVKHALAEVLAEHPVQAVRLSAADARMLDARAAEHVASVQRHGWHVVGDLADLVAGSEAPEQVDNDATADQLQDATYRGLVGLLDVVAGLHQERQEVADHFEQELERTQAELLHTQEELRRAQRELGLTLPRLTVHRIAARHWALGRLRDQFRRLRRTDLPAASVSPAPRRH